MTCGSHTTGRLLPTAACATILLAGCVTTLDVKNQADLREAFPDPVRVLTVDRVEYTLTTYSADDSVLRGKGTIRADTGLVSFNGSIPFSRIVYIQATKSSVTRGLLAAGMILTAAVFLGEAASDQGLGVFRPSEGSCPYVYARNGDAFVIQGESFGTAFGRALETRTSCMLPDLGPEGDVCIRLTNERPETHYVNSLRVRAFETPAGGTVVLDATGRAWPLVKPLGPIAGPEELRASDGVRWKSDLSAAGVGGDYRDRVMIAVPRSGDATTGSIVVSAINTRLVNAVYDQVFGFLGDQSLRFLYEVEFDPALVRTLQDWIRECALTVEVWKKGSWVVAGTILPEANEVPFRKAVRVDADGVTGDSLLLRLSSLADTWELDAVEVDWTPAGPLPERTCRTESAGHSLGASVDERLRATDDAYVRLLPGEWIEVRAERCTRSAGNQITYALDATGYLYEWVPGLGNGRTLPAQPAALEQDRVAAVKELLRHRELFLGMVFAGWQRMRLGLPPVN